MNPIIISLAVAVMVATWVGLTLFIVRYRPYWLTRHHPAGRHLLVMTWALWGLYTVSLVGMVVVFPPWLEAPLVLAVLGAICFAVWQRNHLLTVARRPVRRPKE